MNPYEEVITPLAHMDVVNEGKKLRAHQDAMQKKTFTKWYNSYLQQRNMKVDDLFKDVGDGIILHNLVEILAQEKNPQKLQPNPRFTAQKLENIQAALNHIKRKGVAVENIGTSEVANGNEVFVLGLSWMLILRFEVQKFSADTQELLRWCKRRTSEYPNVKIDNFTSSFQDGLALNALIHKHAPELIDYASLSPENALANIQNALDVAEREFGMPKLLEATDLLNNPEEKSVITYVARLRDALSTREEQFRLEEQKAEEETRRKAAEKRAAEEEARLLAAEQARKKAEEDARLRAEAEARRKAEEEAVRLAAEEAARKRAEEAARKKAEEDEKRAAAEKNKSIEDLNNVLPLFINREKQEQETDKLIADYNLKAKDLADWIQRRDETLKNNVQHNKLGDTLAEVEDKIDHLHDGVDPKEKEKLDLETLNNTINTRLKMENRPRLVHDVPIEQVNTLWTQASTTEQGYKKLLLDHREALLRQQVTLDRFRRIATKLEDWINVCAEVISRTELGESIVDTTELIAEHERFTRDSRSQAKVYRELVSVAKLLAGHPEVEERSKGIAEVFEALPQRTKERMDQLQKELVRQRQIEANRLKFFEDIRDFEEYLFTAEEYAHNPLETDTDQAIIAILDPLKRVAASITLHDTYSPEEEAELNEARARLDGVVPQLEKRREAIKEEQQKKKQVEELYQKFARTASQFGAWYSKMASLISDDGTPELLRQRAKSVQSGLGEGQTHLNNATAQQASIDSFGLFGPNPYTIATVPSFTAQYTHLKKWADDRSEKMQNNPPVTNHHQVVRALDIITQDKGVVNPDELSAVLPAESVDYLKRKTPANSVGEIEYTKFNPYPEDNFVQRRSSTLSSSGSLNRLSQATSPATTPLSPQENAPKRNSIYTAPSRTRTSFHASGGQTPVMSMATPVSSAASPMLSSPTLKTEEDANLPHFDDSMRKRKELEENLYLYTTQTLTSPLAIRYEVEVDKHEHIEFRVSFEGSQNIKLLKPANATNMIAVAEVPAFKTKVVAIVQQIDPFQEASLKNKYSWASRVM